MLSIDLKTVNAEALQSYDSMMVEVSIKISDVSSLSVYVWQEVLKELAERKLVALVSGSFDDVGNALIARNYQTST